MTQLVTWENINVDEGGPYPWENINCPACGEPDLARDLGRPYTGFVCVNCGTLTTIEAP